MCKQEITFDKLPQAITYLTEQVAELKQLVSELQPPQSEKHLLVGIDDACRIIQKAKPTVYTLVRKGLLPSYKKGKQLYFYEDELYAWIENGRKHSVAPSLAETAAAITAGMKRRPRGGYNF